MKIRYVVLAVLVMAFALPAQAPTPKLLDADVIAIQKVEIQLLAQQGRVQAAIAEFNAASSEVAKFKAALNEATMKALTNAKADPAKFTVDPDKVEIVPKPTGGRGQ